MRTSTRLPSRVVCREEYNKLFDFVEKKGLKVRNAKRLDNKAYKEDQFAGSDEELDPYKEALKEDANSADEDSDSEEDEDFDVDKAVRKQNAAKDSSEGTGSVWLNADAPS